MWMLWMAMANAADIETIRWLEGPFGTTSPAYGPGPNGTVVGARTGMGYIVMHRNKTPLPTLAGMRLQQETQSWPGILMHRIREVEDGLLLEVWTPENMGKPPTFLRATVATGSLVVFEGDGSRFPSRVAWEKTPTGIRAHHRGVHHGVPVDEKREFVTIPKRPTLKR